MHGVPEILYKERVNAQNRILVALRCISNVQPAFPHRAVLEVPRIQGCFLTL